MASEATSMSTTSENNNWTNGESISPSQATTKSVSACGDDGQGARGRPILGHALGDDKETNWNAEAAEFVPQVVTSPSLISLSDKVSKAKEKLGRHNFKAETVLRELCGWIRGQIQKSYLTYDSTAENLIQTAEGESVWSLPLAQITAYLAFNLKTVDKDKINNAANLPMFDILANGLDSHVNQLKHDLAVDGHTQSIDERFHNFLTYMAHLYMYLPSPETGCRYTPLATCILDTVVSIFAISEAPHHKACYCALECILIAGAALDEDAVAVDNEAVENIYTTLREWLADAKLGDKYMAMDVIQMLEIRAAGWPKEDAGAETNNNEVDLNEEIYSEFERFLQESGQA